MVRLWIGTNLCLLWWVSVSLRSRWPLNTNCMISFLLWNLKCKTSDSVILHYNSKNPFVCYSSLDYAKVCSFNACKFQFCYMWFCLTSIHCKNKKQRKEMRVLGRSSAVKLTVYCLRLSSEIFSRLRVFKIKTKTSLYSSECIELKSLLLFGFGLRFWGARWGWVRINNIS